jgi:N-acylneuraminate cytidylyltransferase
MSNIAIIPARGGSKRIPRKNVRHFLGKPIMAYAIQAALNSNLFDEVMVSTDDEEIKEIAMEYGANVPFFRTPKNSSDFATTFDVLEEVLLEYSSNGIYFENTCCIYPCTPLLNTQKLLEAYTKLTEENMDAVFPIIQYSTPINRALQLKEQKLSMIAPENINTRSQDLLPAYFDAGQFYWFNNKKVLPQKKLLTENTGAIVLTELEAHDIDNEMDWKMAELKFALTIKN